MAENYGSAVSSKLSVFQEALEKRIKTHVQTSPESLVKELPRSSKHSVKTKRENSAKSHQQQNFKPKSSALFLLRLLSLSQSFSLPRRRVITVFL